MKNWPVTSALVAILINFLIISSVFFFAYSAFSPEPSFEDEDHVQSADLDTVTEEQQRVLTVRRRGQGGPRTETLNTNRRQPSSGRLSPSRLGTSRDQVPSQSNGRMTRCASFPSCRWDISLQGVTSSAAYHSSRPLHKHGPHYHSNDDLGGCRGCSCPDGVVGGGGELGGEPLGLQDLPASPDSRIERDPYYILNFRGGRAWKSRRRPYADGRDETVDDVFPAARAAGDRGKPVAARPGALRSRFSWRNVPENGELSSSSTECVHTRAANRRRRRVKRFSLEKSSDSEEEHRCDHSHDYFDHDELTINGHLKSRVPDGATSSSECLHQRAPLGSTLSTVDSGPISAERSLSRTLSDSDHNEAGNKRSVNRTRARFGLSLKRILSKKEDKSS